MRIEHESMLALEHPEQRPVAGGRALLPKPRRDREVAAPDVAQLGVVAFGERAQDVRGNDGPKHETSKPAFRLRSEKHQVCRAEVRGLAMPPRPAGGPATHLGDGE